MGQHRLSNVQEDQAVSVFVYAVMCFVVAENIVESACLDRAFEILKHADFFRVVSVIACVRLRIVDADLVAQYVLQIVVNLLRVDRPVTIQHWLESQSVDFSAHE